MKIVACISALSHNIAFKIHCLKILACISALMHCSDFVFIISTICKWKMALGTSVEAAIEKYSAKVGLGFPAISKMELFVTLTLYDCHKELHLRCCRGPWSARGYKLSFYIDHHVNFPCLQKKITTFFFFFFFFILWGFVHQWYIFFLKSW